MKARFNQDQRELKLSTETVDNVVDKI